MEPTQSKESAGELVIHKSGNGHECEGDHADAEGPAVGVVELSCHEIDAVKRGATDRGQAQEVGQLVHDDDHRHTGQKAGDDRCGKEIGDPAEAQETDEDDDHSGHHGEDPDQVDIAGRVGRSKMGDPDSKKRGDGGVRPHRHLRVRPEQGEETVPAMKA